MITIETIVGTLLILGILVGYAEWMQFIFNKAVGAAHHVDSSKSAPPATDDSIMCIVEDLQPQPAQTRLDDPVFQIKFCRGCNKRTGFDGGECNFCAMPFEDADLRPHEIYADIDEPVENCGGSCRKAHIIWCKERAKAELPNAMLAIASMTSDLTKHEETADLAHMMAMFAMTTPTAGTTAHFIDGFNEGSCTCAVWEKAHTCMDNLWLECEACADEGGEEE